MGPLTSFLLSQSAGSVGPLQSKLAEKTLTPADVSRLAEDLVSEWQTDPELKARSLALIGKHPKDSISHRDLEMMVRLLHATHSKNAAANDTAALFRRAQATQKKMLPVLHREQARLDKQFKASFEPFSSVHMGINLPDEGASDIDLNVGVHDVAAFSKRLSDAGIPFTKSRDNTRVHTYNTPEGYEVELKVRPKAEVDYQIPGRGRILALPDHAKARFIKEKYDAKMSGDPDRYNAMKYRLYEEHGMIPAGGDWSSVTKKAATTDYGIYSGERFHPQHVHNAANAVGMKWDNNPVFKRRCREWVGKEHLDAMTPAELGTVVGHVLRTTSLMAKHLTPAQIAKVTQQDPELHALCEMELGELAVHGSLTKAKAHQLFGLTEKTAEVEYHGKTFPGYNKPIASDKKEKKMMVLAKKGDEVKLVHFGQKGYQHNYSPEAKQNYLTRSAGIRNKSGQLTKDDPFSPNYWARKVLWPKGETGHGHNGPVNTGVRVSSEKKASLFDTIAARKEDEKWAAAAKLAENENFAHGAELAGLGMLAAPVAASVIGKKFKIPGLQHFGENEAVKHTSELVGLGTMGVPAVAHFLKKKPAATGQQ